VARFTASAGGVRADRFLAEQVPGSGRKALADAFEAGRVRVNGKRAKKGQMLAAGDIVELAGAIAGAGGEAPLPDPEAGAALVVLHEDPRIVVVAKAAGPATHPLQPGERGTVASAVVARWPSCARASEAPREGGAAHRLDAGTSGALAFARDRAAWLALRAAFHEGRVEKSYLALVESEVARGGEVDLPIVQRGPRAVVVPGDPDGLEATTRYEVEARYQGYTLLRCFAETGRMHQVRVHLAFAGMPIVGDATYGTARAGFIGHFLHAATLRLPHPDDGRLVRFEAPLPRERQALLDSLTPR
jgi:23S rRNA pseudouridine1911/1915/1917 synthase